MKRDNSQKLMSLQALYGRNKKAVAFMDESYQLPNKFGKKPFYIFAAVIVPAAKLDQVRQAIRVLVSSDRWHTSENVRRAHGFETANALLSLANSRCKVIIRKSDDFESLTSNGETIRAQVIRQTLEAILGLVPEVGVAVFDRRPEGYLASQDKKTISRLRAESFLPSSFRVAFVSPAIENLLWLPDVVAWFERPDKSKS